MIEEKELLDSQEEDIDIEELEKEDLLNNYQVVKSLGHGSYANVYLVKNDSNQSSSFITLMYAGLIILSTHMSSSILWALQPTILAMANIAV